MENPLPDHYRMLDYGHCAHFFCKVCSLAWRFSDVQMARPVTSAFLLDHAASHESVVKEPAAAPVPVVHEVTP